LVGTRYADVPRSQIAEIEIVARVEIDAAELVVAEIDHGDVLQELDACQVALGDTVDRVRQTVLRAPGMSRWPDRLSAVRRDLPDNVIAAGRGDGAGRTERSLGFTVPLGLLPLLLIAPSIVRLNQVASAWNPCRKSVDRR
jgi:hypothetical protein